MTAAHYDLTRKLGEDIRVLLDLFLDQQLMYDHDHSEPAVFKGRPNFSISCSLLRCIVVRTVNENTGTGPPIAFVIEIRLDHHTVGRSVLGEIR